MKSLEISALTGKHSACQFASVSDPRTTEITPLCSSDSLS